MMKWALLAALVLLGSACGGGEAPSPPNIILVTLDTTRADHLSTYGYFRETSPALDALAAESLVFERFIVPMATTLPTHMSILTGTHPLEHGVLANSTQGGRRFVPSAQLRSFAELSREAGYGTGAFVSASPLKRGSGAESGFEVFDQPRTKHRDAEATTDAALGWLEEQSAPFFAWVHFYDAHYPYTMRAEFAHLYQTDAALEQFIEERKISPATLRPMVQTIDVAEDVANAYDAEIRFADTQLERILEHLRSRPDWDRTVVVVAGDHGEGLCQHDLSAHGSTWNEQLHAPLLMRIPGVAPGRVPIRLGAVDALPTLMGQVDLPQAAQLIAQSSGQDVMAPQFAQRAILSQDTGRERSEGVPFRYALSEGEWKFFRLEHGNGDISHELYDLGRDPHELEDVLAQNPEVGRRLCATLNERIAALSRRGEALRGGGRPQTQLDDPAVMAELQALGYVEAETAEPSVVDRCEIGS